MKRITSYLMKAFIILLMLSFMVGISSPVGAQEAAPPDAPPPVTSLMVKFKLGVTPDEQTAAITMNGGALTSSIPQLRIFVVEVPESDASAVMESYKSDPAVHSVEINQTRKTQATFVPSDAEYVNQWALPKIGWDWVYDNVSPNGSATVAILDTGVDALHPELAPKVIDGFSVFDTIDTTTKGKTDPNGHGTMLAGIVAAQTNNALGIAGVAYTGVQIIPVTVLGADGTGQDSDVIAGLLWAVEQNANVILMGFSNPGFSQNLQDAIDIAWEQGAVLVAATGNDGSSVATYPAGDRGVMGVTATDQNDALLGGSNYGPAVFLAAPGNLIYTTAVGPVEDGDSSYTLVSGTSASSAVVAGVAAFMKAVDSTLTNGVIVGRLARSAEPVGTQEQTGNGRVNMARALGSEGDMGLDPIQTAGVAPEGIDGTGLGNGGPFVGPYTIAAKVLTISKVGTGTGTVSSSTSPAISCGSTCSVSIGNNDTGTLTATPNSNSYFAGWTGTWSSGPQGNGTTTCTGATSPCTFNMGNDAQDLTARFTLKTSLTASVTAADKTYDGNNTATITGCSLTGVLAGDVGNVTCTAGGATFASSNASTSPQIVTATGITLSGSAAGKYTLSSNTATTTATISKATSSVTVTCTAGPFSYTGSAITPCTASYSTSDGLSGPLTVSYTDNTSVGTAGASATYAGDSNHEGSTGTGSFAIIKATSSVTVTCTAGAPHTYTGSSQTPCTAEATGVGMDPVNVTSSLSYLNNINVGAATASASWAGDANHTESTGNGGFTITQAEPTCIVTGYSVNYDGTAHTATGSCTGVKGEALSGLNLSDTTHTTAGTYTDTWTFTDATGNYINKSGTIIDTINALIFNGFLSPLGGADGTGGSFAFPLRTVKLGSTLPMKFMIYSGNSLYLTGIHTLQAIKYSNATSEEAPITVTATDAATTGNEFRLTDSQWHFNLSTKKGLFSEGTWLLKATLADGTSHTVWIGIKK